jgi:hypothetical protein
MDWREAFVSFRIAIFGVLGTALVLAVFRAFLEAHPI